MASSQKQIISSGPDYEDVKKALEYFNKRGDKYNNLTAYRRLAVLTGAIAGDVAVIRGYLESSSSYVHSFVDQAAQIYNRALMHPAGKPDAIFLGIAMGVSTIGFTFAGAILSNLAIGAAFFRLVNPFSDIGPQIAAGLDSNPTAQKHYENLTQAIADGVVHVRPLGHPSPHSNFMVFSPDSHEDSIAIISSPFMTTDRLNVYRELLTQQPEPQG